MFRRKQKQDDELAYLLVRYPYQNQSKRQEKKQPKSALLEKPTNNMIKTTDFTKPSLCILSLLFFYLHVSSQVQAMKVKKNTLSIFCPWHTFNMFPSLTHGLSSFGKLPNPVSGEIITYSGYLCLNSFKKYTFIIQ